MTDKIETREARNLDFASVVFAFGEGDEMPADHRMYMMATYGGTTILYNRMGAVNGSVAALADVGRGDLLSVSSMTLLLDRAGLWSNAMKPFRAAFLQTEITAKSDLLWIGVALARLELGYGSAPDYTEYVQSLPERPPSFVNITELPERLMADLKVSFPATHAYISSRRDLQEHWWQQFQELFYNPTHRHLWALGVIQRDRFMYWTDVAFERAIYLYPEEHRWALLPFIDMIRESHECDGQRPFILQKGFMQFFACRDFRAGDEIVMPVQHEQRSLTEWIVDRGIIANECPYAMIPGNIKVGADAVVPEWGYQGVKQQLARAQQAPDWHPILQALKKSHLGILSEWADKHDQANV